MTGTCSRTSWRRAPRWGRWLACAALVARLAAEDPACAWPPIGREQKPWTYQWWLGSAVDRAGLAREYERYRIAGLGGAHIIPIYGAIGAEDRYLPYLSPAWFAALDAAVDEAGRRDLGIDLTTGTGWCFGGPAITSDEGCVGLTTVACPCPPDGRIPGLPGGHRVLRWLSLAALGPDGARKDLTTRAAADGTLAWRAPGPGWRLAGVATWPSAVAVKRAAPGGAGLMIDPFSPAAMGAFLDWLTPPFATYTGRRPRALYHDSFEYVPAAWAPEVAAAFAARRGYALAGRYDAFAGAGDPDTVARVWHDYRLTVSDLMVEEVFPRWTAWAGARAFQTRNQAHGAPGNLLDLYALADIPETEMFGHGGGDPLVSRCDERIGAGARDVLCSKFASSAAHVMGRRLCSAETGTWAAEHFHESFEELKCLCDRLFAAGVDHVFWHGSAYSPDDAPWPGWLFYAASELNPRNPLWREMPALSDYVARTQAVLQADASDHDVLVYWPLEDSWQDPTPGLRGLTVDDRGWIPAAARALWARGWQFDMVSDRQLARATASAAGAVASEGGTLYRTVLVPSTATIPDATLASLLRLADAGATICCAAPLPADVPGLGRLAERRAAFAALRARLGDGDAQAVRSVAIGRGRVLVGPAEAVLAEAGARREPAMDQAGVLVDRHRHAHGGTWFVANQSLSAIDAVVTPADAATGAVAMDPLSGRTGGLDVLPDGGLTVHLEPGHSLIVRSTDHRPAAPAFVQVRPGPVAATLAGPWDVEFIAGGPALPAARTCAALASWADAADPVAAAFGGTARYRTTCDRPGGSGPWLLDLGEVREVCRVRFNGRELGALIMRPFRLLLPADGWRERGNVLEVEVTNLGANRIRDLAIRQVPWRTFHDANVVDITYHPLDATRWPLAPSGLLGPVRLLVAAP